VVPYGICKVVPPKEWRPPCQVSLNNPKRFKTKRQQINTLQEGQGFDDGGQYTIAEYKAMAEAFYKTWCDKHHADRVAAGQPIDQETLAKDYWNIVETSHRTVAVEYGNDLDTVHYASGFLKQAPAGNQPAAQTHIKTEHSGSPGTQQVKQEGQDLAGFDREFYATTGWNLNNIPTTKGSLLQYLRTPINGINVPWLYIGMLFASFCWHNEDNYFYSISYNHFGATKQWYSVPGESAAQFEKVRNTPFPVSLCRT
jgi:hypothetical protein